MVAEQPLERRLALSVLEAHPGEAARVLEGLARATRAALLADAPPESAAPALAALAPSEGAAVLEAMERSRAARLLEVLPPERAALLLRRTPEPARSALREGLGPRAASRVGALLRYPPRSAGALASPDAVALPEDVPAEEALRRLRAEAEQAYFYLYVVDREGRLAGVLDLRELLRAPPEAPLASLARRPVQRLRARDDVYAVLEHPGWEELRALPVVDEAGRFVGALRRGALLRLAAELGRAGAQPDATARALGELFGSGMAAVGRAMAAALAPGSGERAPAEPPP